MSQPTPKVWSFNPSVITLLILIASLIGGGGYYLGRQDAQLQNMQKQVDDAGKVAQNAKDTVLINGGSEETPTPSPTPKGKK